MLKRKPIFPLNETPEDIVGHKVMPLLEQHFMLSLKETDSERYEKVMQNNFKEHERALIAESYEKLREKGIWPKSINKYGSIEWGIVIRSDLQNYVESLPLPTRQEMKNG